MLSEPTTYGKTLLAEWDSVDSAAWYAEQTGGDVLDVYLAHEQWTKEALPALNAMPWKSMIRKYLQDSIKRLENDRSAFLSSYMKIVPFSKRKSLYEAKIPVYDKVIKHRQSLLELEPKFNWTPLDLETLRRQGKEKWVSLHWHEFFSTGAFDDLYVKIGE